MVKTDEKQTTEAIEKLKQAIRHVIAGQPTEALDLINQLDEKDD